MKFISRISINLLVLFITLPACAQERPVRWNCFAKKLADRKYELHLIADIDSGWHIYTSFPQRNPVCPHTNIKIFSNPLLLFPACPQEKGNLLKNYYSRSVDFIREVNLSANTKTEIAGSIEFT